MLRTICTLSHRWHRIRPETHVHDQQRNQLPRPAPAGRPQRELEPVGVERMAQRAGPGVGDILDTDERCGLEAARVLDAEDEVAQVDAEMGRGEGVHDGAGQQREP